MKVPVGVLGQMLFNRCEVASRLFWSVTWMLSYRKACVLAYRITTANPNTSIMWLWSLRWASLLKSKKHSKSQDHKFRVRDVGPAVLTSCEIVVQIKWGSSMEPGTSQQSAIVYCRLDCPYPHFHLVSTTPDSRSGVEQAPLCCPQSSQLSCQCLTSTQGVLSF